MDNRGIQQMIGELRVTAQAAAGKASQAGSAHPAETVDFAQVLQSTLHGVSAAQNEARAMSREFSAGNPDVNLQEVMVNLEKASLSFQQMVQVRNRLVSAYQDIMNMPV